jgi:hypothetical protein
MLEEDEKTKKARRIALSATKFSQKDWSTVGIFTLTIK